MKKVKFSWKWLCFIGIHNWEVTGNFGLGGTFFECKRCEKQKSEYDTYI